MNISVIGSLLRFFYDTCPKTSGGFTAMSSRDTEMEEYTRTITTYLPPFLLSKALDEGSSLLRKRDTLSALDRKEEYYEDEDKEQITPEEIERRKHDWGRTYLSKYTATARDIIMFDEYRQSLRGKILSFLEFENKTAFIQGSKAVRNGALAYQVINVILVMLSTTSFIVATEPEYHLDPPALCQTIDIISVLFFTFDYITRLVCAYSQFRFLIALFNIFDFLSFVPMYIEWIIILSVGHEAAAGVEFLRFFRLFRVFRLMRLIQFSITLKLVLKSIRQSTEGFVLLWMVIMLDLVFFSTTMFFVEGSYCWFDAENFEWKYLATNDTSNFQSIAGTFWWNIVSITTVGYGDVVPHTTGGKFVASIALVSGLVLLAFPIAIFGTNFHTLYEDWLEKEREKVEGPLAAGDPVALAKELTEIRRDFLELKETIHQEQLKTEEHQRQMMITLDKLFLSIMYNGKKEGKKGNRQPKQTK